MSFLEECHVAHKERLERLSRRAPEAVQVQKPVVRIIYFDKTGRRIAEYPSRPVPAAPLPVSANERWRRQVEQYKAPLVFVERITVAQVIQAVADAHNLSVYVLLMPDRSPRACRPRHIAAYLARIMIGASRNRIGKALGGRDHTTVMHSFRTMAALVGSDPEVFTKVDSIKRILLDRRNGETA
jgi:hypothetical protein